MIKTPGASRVSSRLCRGLNGAAGARPLFAVGTSRRTTSGLLPVPGTLESLQSAGTSGRPDSGATRRTRTDWQGGLAGRPVSNGTAARGPFSFENLSRFPVFAVSQGRAAAQRLALGPLTPGAKRGGHSRDALSLKTAPV